MTTLVTLPKLHFLAVDGHGDPNTSQEFKDAVEALFSVSYTLKFMVKKGPMQIDYKVMPLEGLWWCSTMEEFTVKDKSNWDWTLLILQPDFITIEMVKEAKEKAQSKKQNAKIAPLRLIEYEEGQALQLLHVGPYSAEAENIQKIHDYIRESGGKFNGLVQKHHEIYLSDMRKTAPEKLKTIIRQSYVV